LSRLNLTWTKHLQNEDQKEQFELVLRNSTHVLGRLKAILKEELIALEGKETSIADFDSPSWAFKQAYLNGDRARLKKVLNLLEFIPD